MGILPDDVDFDSPWDGEQRERMRLKQRIAELEAELARWKQNAEFYKSCALSGQVPTPTNGEG